MSRTAWSGELGREWTDREVTSMSDYHAPQQNHERFFHLIDPDDDELSFARTLLPVSVQ
jgi:hypothetical protein